MAQKSGDQDSGGQESGGQGESENPTARGVVGGTFDKRLTPARDDVAADWLEGRVTASAYVRGEDRQVTAPVLPIRRTPEPGGAQETQALFGEVFTVYDEAGGWAWGQARIDGYVGYVEAGGLSAPVEVPTHRVTALRSYRFPEPDLKSAPIGLLSMNAKLAVTGESEDGKWLSEARGGWVFGGHAAPLSRAAEDPVAVMEAYLGAPYFWGGRESLGLDCSGIVQNGYEAAGLVPPRDADMQELWFSAPDRGETLWQTEEGGDWKAVPLRRGDLVYWAGHTGVMADGRRLLHANATSMAVTCDDLEGFADHLMAEKDNPVTRLVRPRPVREMAAG